MYRHIVGVSRNGCELYVNLIQSSAGRYLSRQPHLISMIREVLATMKLADHDILVEQDMGRVIGNTNVVVTSEKDNVFYAQPAKKTISYRFVKNRSPSPSPMLTIILEQDSDDNYEIVDTWVGEFRPPFPGDERATGASGEYWKTHALVADAEVIQLSTVTKVCPY